MANSSKTPKEPQAQMNFGLSFFFKGLRSFLSNLIDLTNGLDKEGTITNIKSNKRMRGANAWLLMCSIVIASLGLDLNSPAIIIGAMLISPLMSPILGVGLGVGINDKNTLIISLQHFGIAIAIALFTSTVYFFFTPFGEITHEISARTEPTLLDAFVAFFGGIAGIISGSRKEKTSAIPGVAIATALMPPLCVTGFGLANLMKYGIEKASISSLATLNNWEIVLNSFYLFFLNAVLVALATYLIVRFLRFPIKKYMNPAERNRTNILVFGIAVLLLIPSISILRGVIKDAKENYDIKLAMENVFNLDMKYVDGWKKIKTDSTTDLLIKVYTPNMADRLDSFQNSLQENLPDITVELIPTSEINFDKFRTIEARFSNMDSMIYNAVTTPRKEKEILLITLENKLAQLQSDSLLERSVEAEVLALYEKYIDKVNFNLPRNSNRPAMLSLQWSDSGNLPKTLIEESLKGYLKQRCQRDTILLGVLAD